MPKIIGVALIVAIGAGLLWVLNPHLMPSDTRLPVAQIPTFNSSSSRLTGPITSSTVTKATASASPTAPFQGWRQLVIDKYRFQVNYPETGWSFFNGDNIADPTVPLGTPLYVANAYTVRLAGSDSHQDQENIAIVIAVYNSGPRVSVRDQLSNTINNFQSVSQGNIEGDLVEAYEGGSGVLSYEATTPGDGAAISELGIVGAGTLSYTTFFEKPGGSFVYAIELQLEFDKQQNDSQYVQIYKTVISSAKFID